MGGIKRALSWVGCGNQALCSCPQHCGDRGSRCRSEMNVLAAWQRGYTGRNVVVTILDDGIERNHPDLLQNYVSGAPGARARGEFGDDFRTRAQPVQ